MKLTPKQIERLVRLGELVHTECKDARGGLPNQGRNRRGGMGSVFCEYGRERLR